MSERASHPLSCIKMAVSCLSGSSACSFETQSSSGAPGGLSSQSQGSSFSGFQCWNYKQGPSSLAPKSFSNTCIFTCVPVSMHLGTHMSQCLCEDQMTRDLISSFHRVGFRVQTQFSGLCAPLDLCADAFASEPSQQPVPGFRSSGGHTQVLMLHGKHFIN